MSVVELIPGLAIIQVGAIIVHVRRHGDLKRLPVNIMLAAVFGAVARFAGA